MNALEAIRKKESDHKALIAALEAQIAEEGVAGQRNFPVLNQIDALKRTQPVTEQERRDAFLGHGQPVILEYLETFETASKEAKNVYIQAVAEYLAARVEANRAGLAWGRDFFPTSYSNDQWNITIDRTTLPKWTVKSAPVCDDVQITE